MAGWRTQRDQEFGDYYVNRVAAMRSTAYLLCGDWHLAEDLCQTAFTKLYLAWHRVSSREALDPYVRRIIFRAYLDDRRRPWRRERPSNYAAPDVASIEPDSDQQMVLLTALSQIPPRQRATLVLRYWEDQSVEDCAHLLGISTGTVKSQASRGLDTLRRMLGDTAPDFFAAQASAS